MEVEVSGPRRSFHQDNTTDNLLELLTESDKKIRNSTQNKFRGTRLSSSISANTEFPKNHLPDNQGIPKKYGVHQNSGDGNSLMMGYLMGHSSLLWMMPFHPAFYYTKPYYVENPDGTMEVYPPTFSIERVFITILIIAGIIYFIFNTLKRSYQYISHIELTIVF